MKKVEIFFSPILTPAYRSQYGSANPTAIIAPAIAATLVSTLVAIVYCKIKDAGAGRRMQGDYGSGYDWSRHNAVGKGYFHIDSIDGKNNSQSSKTGSKGEKAV